MSEHAPVQTQRVSTPQAAVKESILPERRERQSSVRDHLMAWNLDAGDISFQPPRTGYNLSRVPALTGLARQAPSLVYTQDDISHDGTRNSFDNERDGAETKNSSASETSAVRALLVEDEAKTLSSGQMRRSEFLEQLQAKVTRTVEAAVAGTGRSTQDCPYIKYWFSFYRRQDGNHIERAIFRYVPEASRVTSAEGYIALILQRARQAAETWAGTGKITGVPPGIPMQLPGMPLVKGVFPGSERIFFKAKGDGIRSGDEPRSVQMQLGEGQPMNRRLRSRMESAFGMDLSHVRTHTGTNAGELSSRHNARAFTVGSHIAFGSGEYQPGTMTGDALIAHELAHVVQQQNAESTVSFKQTDAPATTALEADADRSAVGVVASLWGGAKERLSGLGLAGGVEHLMPRLKSGLQLQRCASRLPALREPQVMQAESQTFQQQASTDLNQRALSLSGETQDTARQTAIATANVEVGLDVNVALSQLWQIFQDELQDAGSDTEAQARAQQRYEVEMQRLRESYMLQFEMSVRWGITFTTAQTQVEYSRMEQRIRHRRRQWSREELETVNSILEQVPPSYMASMRNRIRKIQREYLGGGSSFSAASWEESTGTLRVFDESFEHPEQLQRIILHEIGHSTVQERTINNFHHLPPDDWMQLSDWRMSTRTGLGADLGISGQALQEAQTELDNRKRLQSGHPRPFRIEERLVIFNKYEPNNIFPPQQFFHYAARHDRPGNEEFVSTYARTHPAEDLAESFAFYLTDRRGTEDKLDSDVDRVNSSAAFRNKWHYLTTNYPHQLIRRKAKGTVGQGGFGPGAGPGHDPGHIPRIQKELGEGRPLQQPVRSRMEPVFGMNFAPVRAHTDDTAAGISGNLDAHAFTLGNHIAFGQGEYRPGTLYGDALIAHELAHVAQQGKDGSGDVIMNKESMNKGGGENHALERDADRSAQQAVTSLWQEAEYDHEETGDSVKPRLRTGLRFSRCPASSKNIRKRTAPPKTKAKTPAKTRQKTTPAKTKTPAKTAKKTAAATTPAKIEPDCPLPTDAKVKQLKAQLIQEFKLKAVTPTGSPDRYPCWTKSELIIVKRALSRLSNPRRKALKGVTLKRVVLCSNPRLSGQFIAKVSRYGVRSDVLEISNRAFDDDEKAQRNPNSRKDAAGKPIGILPSEETILHEVGHAISTARQRDAESRLGIASGVMKTADDEIKDARADFISTRLTGYKIPGNRRYSRRERRFFSALGRTHGKILAVQKILNSRKVKKLATKRTAGGFRGTLNRVRWRIAAATKAGVMRNRAYASLPQKSKQMVTGMVGNVITAQKTIISDAKRLLKAFLDYSGGLKKYTREKRRSAAVASFHIRVQTGTVAKVTPLEAELVAIVNLEKINVTSSKHIPLYAKDEWPGKPEELFAELFQVSIIQPVTLRAINPHIAAFFRDPIGVKGRRMKWKVRRWIAGNKQAKPKKKKKP